MDLLQAIIQAAAQRGINPYQSPFKPNELGLRASDWGSFSDHCRSGTTKSSKYGSGQFLTVAQTSKNGRPFRYLLV